MNKKLVAVVFGAGMAALAMSKAASAHVNLAVGIGFPSPVVVAPAPVYVAPAPAYVAPAPVAVGYWRGDDGWREREWRRREWREHEWRAREWHGHRGWDR